MARPDPYGDLRRHLDAQPVGFPATASGVERRILETLFEPDEARAALGLSASFRTEAEAAEALAARGVAVAGPVGATYRRMAAKGSILYREAEGTYALLPFVVGMYELQLPRLDREFFRDATKYFREGFGLEYLAAGTHQTRIIPIGEAVRPGHRVATYDEFRSIIEGAGERIAVVDCICRKAADLEGRPCRVTERRELCMVFRDYADTALREGWGRRLGKDEALGMLERDVEEGLVLRPSNEAEPQFICACCGDCCGLLSVAKAVPRPADYVASSWRARVEDEKCVGCGLCARRCPMEAIEMRGAPPGRGRGSEEPVKGDSVSSGASGAGPAAPLSGPAAARRPIAHVLEARCIGCGVCALKCPTKAVALDPRDDPHVPPRNGAELLARLAATRPSFARKIGRGLRAILGIKIGR